MSDRTPFNDPSLEVAWQAFEESGRAREARWLDACAFWLRGKTIASVAPIREPNGMMLLFTFTDGTQAVIEPDGGTNVVLFVDVDAEERLELADMSRERAAREREPVPGCGVAANASHAMNLANEREARRLWGLCREAVERTPRGVELSAEHIQEAMLAVRHVRRLPGEHPLRAEYDAWAEEQGMPRVGPGPGPRP